MISQPLVVRFSFCLIFCKPHMKLYNRHFILFCPNLDRLAAILKYVEFYLKFIVKSISQLLVVRFSQKKLYNFITLEETSPRQSLKTFMLALQKVKRNQNRSQISRDMASYVYCLQPFFTKRQPFLQMAAKRITLEETSPDKV